MGRVMSTEKANGKSIPLFNLWVLEDRLIAQAMAEMEKDEAFSIFPKTLPQLDNKNLGLVVIFGTGGEMNEGTMFWEEIFNKPEGYNLI